MARVSRIILAALALSAPVAAQQRPRPAVAAETGSNDITHLPRGPLPLLASYGARFDGIEQRETETTYEFIARLAARATPRRVYYAPIRDSWCLDLEYDADRARWSFEFVGRDRSESVHFEREGATVSCTRTRIGSYGAQNGFGAGTVVSRERRTALAIFRADGARVPLSGTVEMTPSAVRSAGHALQWFLRVEVDVTASGIPGLSEELEKSPTFDNPWSGTTRLRYAVVSSAVLLAVNMTTREVLARGDVLAW